MADSGKLLAEFSWYSTPGYQAQRAFTPNEIHLSLHPDIYIGATIKAKISSAAKGKPAV